MSSPLNLLDGLGLAAAAIGVVFYLLAVLRPPRGARLVQSSGLLFTSLGLGALAVVGGRVAHEGVQINAALGQLLLTVAILIQAWSGIRRRRTYAGIDRRGPTTLS